MQLRPINRLKTSDKSLLDKEEKVRMVPSLHSLVFPLPTIFSHHLSFLFIHYHLLFCTLTNLIP